MKLNVILSLDCAESLYAPCFRSLQEGIQFQWADQLRIFLVRPAGLVEGFSFAQLSRLRELEALVSDHYSGAVLIDCSVIEASCQVSLIYPDYPITFLSLSHIVGIDSVRHLLNELWVECADAVYISPVASPVISRTAHRLNHRFYSAFDSQLDVNIFALLRDLALGSCNLVWPGNLFQRAFDASRKSSSGFEVGYADSFLLTQLLLLGERVRLAELSIALVPPGSGACISVYGLCERDEVVRLFSIVRDATDQSLLRFVYSVLIDCIAGLSVHKYLHLRHGSRCLSSYRQLFDSLKSSLLANLSLSSPGACFRQAVSCDFRSILHHGYFEINGRPSSSVSSIQSEPCSAETLSSLLNPSLASSLRQGLELLPQSELTTLSREPLDFSWGDLAFNPQLWFCLAEADIETVGEHAACFDISASTDSLLMLKWVATPGSLHELTIMLPASCVGTEIRVNFNLKRGQYKVVSGDPVSIEMSELLDDVWQIQVAAKVVSDYQGPVQLRTCRGNSSYYQPSGSGSIHFSSVEYALVSPELVQSYPVSSLEAYRSKITGLQLDALRHLPPILDWPYFAQSASPALCIEFYAERSSECMLKLDASCQSGLVLSKVVDVTASEDTRSYSVSEVAQVPEPSRREVRSSVIAVRSGLNRFRLEFAVKSSQSVLSGFAQRLILSRLSLDLAFNANDCDALTQASESAENSSPLLSVVSVAFGMHELVPGWLHNYSLQSIHDFTPNPAEMLLGDVDLSLPLLIYSSAFGKLAGLRIRIVPFVADPGLYECWNRLIRSSRAKYISNYNPDDRKLPDHLSALCHILEETGAKVAASACHVFRFQKGDPIPVEPSAILAHEEKWWAGSGDVCSILRLNVKRLFREPSPGDYQSNNMLHSMPVWRRSLHDQYGFFDEALHGTYADYAFWINVLAAGEVGIFADVPLYLFSVIGDSHNRINANSAVLSRLIDSARLSY
jgi:hypothetical protein